MDMPVAGCPGAAAIKGTPTLKEKTCPQCGGIIELFSTDIQIPCSCGFIAYNDIQSCVRWCAYARRCVGDEAYENMMNLSNKKVEYNKENDHE